MPVNPKVRYGLSAMLQIPDYYRGCTRPLSDLKVEIPRSSLIKGQRLQVESNLQQIEVDPLIETLYLRLMCCLRDTGRVAEALATYQRCQTILAALRAGHGPPRPTAPGAP